MRAVLVGMVLAALAVGPAMAQQKLDLPFAVYMKGDRIGTHAITVERRDDEARVSVAIDLTVKFGFIPVFSYTHRAQELWQANRLVSLDSTTRENGDDMYLRLKRAQSGELVGDSNLGPQKLPGELIPTSYWNRALTRQSLILNSQDGAEMAVQVTPMGTETVMAFGQPVDAEKYVMTGDLRLQLWYDQADRLVKLSFERRGRQIDYVLEP